MSEYPELQDLELPIRAISAFKINGITTREQLCALSPSGVLRLSNVGPNTLRQILEALGKHKLSLAPDDWQRKETDAAEPRSTSIGQAVHDGFEKARADLVKEQERANTILTAKLSRAITGFNRVLDLLAAERIKGGISIEVAHDQVIKARQEFDAGLEAIDDEYDAKHAPKGEVAS